MGKNLSLPLSPVRPPGRSYVVGVVHSPGTLAAALRLSRDAGPDLLELRVDAFAVAPGQLDELVAAAPRPFLLTVRDGREGGADPALSPARRRELFERFLPAAALVDIELRALDHPDLAAVAAAARARGVGLVVSFHDFTGTPGSRRLRTLARRARDRGADVFKVAAHLETPGDLARLLGLFEPAPSLPLAVMGMGERFGRASRLALAAAGSVLAYGSLDADEPAVASGQWSAAWLREFLEAGTVPG